MRDELICAGSPNFKELADLIRSARGFRTGEEYAKLLGINASTLSRIFHMRYSKALPKELLQKIADTADSGSGVTLQQLYLANGYSAPDEHSAAILRERMLGRLIREFSGCRLFLEPKTKVADGVTYSPLDLLIATDSSQVGFVFLFGLEFSSKRNDIVRKVMKCISELFLIEEFNLDPHLMDVTFFFNEEETYYSVVRAFEHLHFHRSSLNVEFSLIDENDLYSRETYSIATPLQA